MRITEDSPADSVGAFAALCAALDDPFADRPAVLGTCRLDEAGFARLQERWAERFIADVDGLGARFAEAYAAARAGGDSPSAAPVNEEHAAIAMDQAPAAVDEIPATDRAPEAQAPVSSAVAPETPAPVEASRAAVVPSFMKASPLASQAPRQPLSTETLAVDFSELLKAAVPFDPSAPSKMAVATVPGAIPGGSPKAPKCESTETVEFDVATLLEGRAPVPFDKPVKRQGVAQEAASPRRRLIRFDPQTGAPLAAPYWQELPAAEDEK